MSRYLLVGDIHLADRPPSSCTDSYTDDLFDLLEQTVDLARDCDAVVWAGDVFHVKTAGRNSHRLVQRTISLGMSYPCPWLIVPGNHDMQHDRLDSLPSQPLGTLFKAGAVPLIGSQDYLYGIPWQQDWRDLSKIVPYATENTLVVAHAPLYPTQLKPPFDEHVLYPDWAKWQQAGYCFYGHVHEAHGITPCASPRGPDAVTFCNNGAITRGSLHESELKRPVCVTKWDRGFVRIELNAKPAEQVFRLVEKGAAKSAKLRLDEFVDAVGSTLVEQVTVPVVMEAAQKKLSPVGQAIVAKILDEIS